MKNTYPIYRKDPAHDCKVISDDQVIQVYRGFMDTEVAIKMVHYKCAFLPGSEDSTEAEFLEAYYLVRKKLNEICLIKIDK